MTEEEGWVYQGEGNDENPWQELDVRHLAMPDGTALVSVWSKRFKSNSPDAERFLHDPRGELLKVPGLGVRDDFTVTTIVVHHERRLLKHPMIVLLLIALGTTTAVVTIYKAPED